MGDAHENAMSPVDCAKQITEAVRNKKEEVYIGGKETKAVLLKRFFPKFFSKKIRTAKVN
ncbi:hypothetical protein D3C85_1698190 [compost metagenome]